MSRMSLMGVHFYIVYHGHKGPLMTVCEMYVRYVTQKYGTATVIVFDGYKEEQTIKDATQLHRAGVTPGVTVHTSPISLRHHQKY